MKNLREKSPARERANSLGLGGHTKAKKARGGGTEVSIPSVRNEKYQEGGGSLRGG